MITTPSSTAVKRGLLLNRYCLILLGVE